MTHSQDHEPKVLPLEMVLCCFFGPTALLDVLIGDLPELRDQDLVHLFFQENSLRRRLKWATTKIGAYYFFKHEKVIRGSIEIFINKWAKQKFLIVSRALAPFPPTFKKKGIQPMTGTGLQWKAALLNTVATHYLGPGGWAMRVTFPLFLL